MFNAPVKFALMLGVAAIAGSQFLARETNNGKLPALASAAASSRPAATVNRASAPVPAGGMAELFREPDGHFHANAEIEGQRLPMLVDTGATIIALTYEDAGTLGVRPDSSRFDVAMSTANGVAKGARVMLHSVAVSGVRVYDVQAVVMPRGALGQSLLGMSYLSKLAAFESRDGRLILRQ